MVIKSSSRVPGSGIADVRVRVVEAVNSGVRMDVAGVCFGVGFSTVKSWVSLARREGMGALQMKGSEERVSAGTGFGLRARRHA